MTTKNKIDLSSIPLEVLIAEIEARKDDEVRRHVTEINKRLSKLNKLGFTPYNKEMLLADEGRWEIISFNIDAHANKVTSVYYNETKVEEY